ncbi:MAG: hypothetical protein JSS50_04780 [Proteobacteria bacterium]|nr:hypothetical protein [Pseudomonadota bacterium]
MRSSIIVLLYICLCAQIVWGAEVYPLSTEIQVSRAKNIIERAPSGAYLTVGGERAFRAAAMFERITNLLIFDLAPPITRFNEINIKLLRAGSSQHYRHLRWEAELVEWQTVAPNLTADDFQWWQQHVRKMPGYNIVEEFNRYGHSVDYTKYSKIVGKLQSVYPLLKERFNYSEKSLLKHVEWADIASLPVMKRAQLNEQELSWWIMNRRKAGSCVKTFIDHPQQAIDLGLLVDYKGGNYLFDEAAYQRLHTLVMADKVALAQVDLTTEAGLSTAVKMIKDKGEKIGIADLNNLFLKEYMGEEKLRSLLNRILEFGTDESVLLLMNNYTRYACAQFSVYVGFTFGNVKKWPSRVLLNEFIDGFNEEESALLNGRLYYSTDPAPFQSFTH